MSLLPSSNIEEQLNVICFDHYYKFLLSLDHIIDDNNELNIVTVEALSSLSFHKIKCSCFDSSIMGLPCQHMISVIRNRRILPDNSI